jgi:hypothetical protein
VATTLRHRTRSLVLLVLGTAAALAASGHLQNARAFDPVGAVNLGAAGGYAVLGLENTQIQNSLVTITGDEGVSRGGKLVNMAPSTINGGVHEYAAGQYSGPGKLSGSIIVDPTGLAQADADARAASAAAAALAPTQTFANIGSDTTVNGNGGLNVIQVNGNITKSLILNGTASDVFVVNVTGTLSLGGYSTLGLSGGVTPNHVLYNFIGAGGTISTTFYNVVYGTILAPDYSMSLDGTFAGEIIGGGAFICLQSRAKVTVPTPTPPKIWLGYADTYFPRGSGLPSPWKGGPGVIFVGCAPQLTDAGPAAPDTCPPELTPPGAGGDSYDAGAVRIDNTSSTPMVVSGPASVSIGTCGGSALPALYTPWPGLNRTIPPGGTLILTQTGLGGDPCGQNLGGNYNFDTTESSGNNNCTPNHVIPVIKLTLNGVPTTINDTGQILNKGGIDVGGCAALGSPNEFQDWIQVS